MKKLDSYNEGDQVKITFSLRGREYTKDGKTTYFTNLDAWRIDQAGASADSPAASSETFPSMADEPSIDDNTDDLPF